MIRYFHKTLKSHGVKELDEFRSGSWVYVQNASEEELISLTEDFKLDPGHMVDSQDMEEMPRLERENEQAYLFARFAHTNERQVLTTTPLLMILHPECLITISFEDIPGLDKFIEKKSPINTTQQGRLVLQILEQIDNQYEAYISVISKQIKATRARLREKQSVDNQDFIDFVILEDELNEFMSALNPMSPILKRLMLGRHFNLHSEDKELVEDLLLNNEQSLEGCRSNLKSITNIREAYSTIMSNDLNRIIRVLTVITVLISIPTMIGGIYGMNLILPYADSPIAFEIVMGTSLTVLVLVMIFLKLKKLL